MKAPESKNGVDVPLLDMGVHEAVISKIVDYGTQESEFEGVKSSKREVRIEFTLPNLKFTFDEERGEELRKKSAFCKVSTHEKSTMYKIFTSITNKSFNAGDEISNYLGVNCQLNINHEKNQKGELRDKIVGFSPAKEGASHIEMKTVMFDLDNFDLAVFQELSEKEQAIIKLSPEFAKLADAPF